MAFAIWQECAIVPANPFPEPTNGKAIGRWKHLRNEAVPDTRADVGTVDEADNQNRTGRNSPLVAPLMAGVAQAALAAARDAVKPDTPEKPGQPDPDSGNEIEKLAVTAGDGGEESPETSPGSDASGEGGRRARFSGAQRAISKGMRQESYYLRGVVEAERDADLLSTIAKCIPGEVIEYTTSDAAVPGADM